MMVDAPQFIKFYTTTGREYYYDKETKKSTYDAPHNAIIIDSVTKKIVQISPGVLAQLQSHSATQTTSIEAVGAQMTLQQRIQIPHLQVASPANIGASLNKSNTIGAIMHFKTRKSIDDRRNVEYDFQMNPAQFQLRHNSNRQRPLSHNYDNQTGAARGSWQSTPTNLAPITLPQNPLSQGSSSPPQSASSISRRNPLQRMQDENTSKRRPSVHDNPLFSKDDGNNSASISSSSSVPLNLYLQKKPVQRRYITLNTAPLMDEMTIKTTEPPPLSEISMNKELQPVNLDCFTVPTLKLSKDAQNVNNDNPFGYKDPSLFHQLPSAGSSAALSSSSIPEVMLNNEDEEDGQLPNSARGDIKVSPIIIDLIINEYKVLPSSIQSKQDVINLVTQYEVIDYARKYFRKQAIKKNNLTIEEILAFSDQPLTKALLHTKSSLKQVGETLSTMILEFIKVLPGHMQNQSALTFLKTIQSHIELVDEAYFQIIRAATDNPSSKWKENAYILFMLMCNLFCPSETAYPYILSWTAKHLVYDAFKVREFFSLTLIRFHHRNLLGNETNDITIEMIENLIEQQEHPSTFFKCTIYEIMWFQRTKYPKLPLPLPLYLIIRELTRKNAVKTANLLTLSSDPTTVEHLAEQILFEHETIETCSIGELMDLLKYWLASITEAIIPKSTIERFLSYDKAPDFISSLPNCNRDSLRYVIGFLQDISNHDEENFSTTSKLTDQFAQLLCNENKFWTEKEKIDQINEQENSFIKEVILNYPTNDIYPLSDDISEFLALKEKL